MRPNRTTARTLGAMALIATAWSSAMPAFAATYVYRQYLPGLIQAPAVPAATLEPTEPLPEPAAPITVSLAAAALPQGQVSSPYSYDLNQLLQVTGDPSYNASQVAWGVTQGALPAGLVMNNGVISGTPTTQSAGASFQATAAYKTVEGQQTYTIVINGVQLVFTQLAVNGSQACGVTMDGGVKCWNHGTTTPTSVAGLTGVTSIAGGLFHMCVVANGGVKCWGANSSGQLGDGTTTNRAAPVDVVGLTSGVALVRGGGSAEHTCAITNGGGLKCWGKSDIFQVGDGSYMTNKLTPVDVTGLASGVVDAALGAYHTCALTAGGGVKCWGSGTSGQLGNGAAGNSMVPADVTGLAGATQISAGSYHTCAVTTDGAAKCWGINNAGQVGNGAALYSGPVPNQLVPITVVGLDSGVARVAAGGYQFSCAVLTNGGAKCWGDNSQLQLAAQLISASSTPRDIPLNAGQATTVVTGWTVPCVLKTDGGVTCWGRGVGGGFINITP